MKKFKSLEEFREYHRQKAKKHYLAVMADPERAAVYKAKRRKQERERYHKAIEDLKTQT